MFLRIPRSPKYLNNTIVHSCRKNWSSLKRNGNEDISRHWKRKKSGALVPRTWTRLRRSPTPRRNHDRLRNLRINLLILGKRRRILRNRRPNLARARKVQSHPGPLEAQGVARPEVVTKVRLAWRVVRVVYEWWGSLIAGGRIPYMCPYTRYKAVSYSLYYEVSLSRSWWKVKRRNS
jgi:hypothetical protein